METKQCGECKRVLPTTEFYKMAAQPDGIHRYCKYCCKVQRAQARVKKRDKKNGVSNRQRYRARVQHNQEDTDEITIDKLYRRDRGICALCGRHVESNLASIDHIIPISKGGPHKWDNVQLMHNRCNKSKGATL